MPLSLRQALTAAAVLALGLLPRHAPADTPAFRVVNRTGTSATALHAVRSPRGAREDWGRNLIAAPLAADQAFNLRAREAAGCLFDVRLVLADGREARLSQQDICANPTLLLEAAAAFAKPPAASPPLAGPGGGLGGSGRSSSGTGFVVARNLVLTNHHVVDGCRRITLRTPEGRELVARAGHPPDARRDLALLAVEGEPGPPLRFRATPAVRRGEAVVTYGFPLSGILSSGPTLTTGEVNALSGLRDNPLQFQISAPVQPGNSGGPLLDRQGHVLGVIVSKLNAAGIAARTGDIPQNVNFAVKGDEALGYLRAAGIAPLQAESTGRERSAAEVGELAHRSTLRIRCEK